MPIEPPDHVVRRLKDDRDVWLVQRPGAAPVVVAAWTCTFGFTLRSLVGAAPPQRILRGARLSALAGVPVPAVAPRMRRAARTMTLERPWIDGADLLSFARGGLEDDRADAVADAVGAIVSRYADAGLVHRDLKLSNLVLAADGTVVVVDTDGVRRTRDRIGAAARMFDRLAVETVDPPIAVPPRLIERVMQAALPRRDDREAALSRLR